MCEQDEFEEAREGERAIADVQSPCLTAEVRRQLHDLLKQVLEPARPGPSQVEGSSTHCQRRRQDESRVRLALRSAKYRRPIGCRPLGCKC